MPLFFSVPIALIFLCNTFDTHVCVCWFYCPSFSLRVKVTCGLSSFLPRLCPSHIVGIQKIFK